MLLDHPETTKGSNGDDEGSRGARFGFVASRHRLSS
jgi:hypothetical protein